MHWESSMSEMKPVITMSPLTAPFSINRYRSSPYLAHIWERMGINVLSVSKIFHLQSVMISAMTSLEGSSSSYSQAIPHGLTHSLRPYNKSSMPSSLPFTLHWIAMTPRLCR
jgi:hypothetical protein